MSAHNHSKQRRVSHPETLRLFLRGPFISRVVEKNRSDSAARRRRDTSQVRRVNPRAAGIRHLLALLVPDLPGPAFPGELQQPEPRVGERLHRV